MNRYLTLRIFFFLGVQSTQLALGQSEQKQNLITSFSIIDANGIDSLTLAISTKEDVIEKYGLNYKVDSFAITKFGPYHSNLPDSVKYKHIIIQSISYPKIGIRFYFEANKKTLLALSVQKPFKAKTRDNLVLGKSSFNDIDSVHGKSAWVLPEHYIAKEIDGITFSAKKGKWPNSNKSESKMLKRSIEEISIGSIGRN